MTGYQGPGRGRPGGDMRCRHSWLEVLGWGGAEVEEGSSRGQQVQRTQGWTDMARISRPASFPAPVVMKHTL